MKEIGNIRFKRAIDPQDAVSMDIETIDFGDASQSLICVWVYARFVLKNGEYSCQLVLSRTRTVPKELSLPRAELYATLLNTHTGEIVRRSFKNLVKSSKKFTDRSRFTGLPTMKNHSSNGFGTVSWKFIALQSKINGATSNQRI